MPDLDKAAGVIARALGDDLDHAFESKSEWNAARGEKGGRFRDINEPFRGDYIAAAEALHDAGLLLPEGYVAVPREPTEAMTDAARGIVMMERFGLPNKQTPLGKVIESGFGGQDWGFAVQADERAIDHRLPKGHVCYLIYRAMIQAQENKG